MESPAFLIYLWIALGSAIGGMARYACSVFALTHFGEAFPWGTLAINVVGSFIIGLFATLTAGEGRLLVSHSTRLFVMVGLCGGFTTFSAFSLQTLILLREGDMLRAGTNIALSIVLCLLAVWLGHALATALNQAKS